MLPIVRMGIAGLSVVLAVAACARTGAPPANMLNQADAVQSITLMQAYDSNHDGVIAKEELETGLQREFAALDANSDGRLSGAETQAENDRRWRESGPASSPLIDWSLDGFVDFTEFAGTARSVFGDRDRDQNGSLSGNEMRPPRALPPGTMPQGEGGRRG